MVRSTLGASKILTKNIFLQVKSQQECMFAYSILIYTLGLVLIARVFQPKKRVIF